MSLLCSLSWSFSPFPAQPAALKALNDSIYNIGFFHCLMVRNIFLDSSCITLYALLALVSPLILYSPPSLSPLSRSSVLSTLAQTLAASDSYSEFIRTNAAIFLKSSLRAVWTRGNNVSARDASLGPAATELRAQERAAVKTTLLSRIFAEPSQKVLAQLMDMVNRISVIDFPRDWHDLFPTLFNAIAAAEATLASEPAKAMEIGYPAFFVLGEVMESRKPVYKPNVASLLETHLPTLYSSWHAFTSRLITASDALQSPSGAAPGTLEHVTALVRVVRHATRALSLSAVECSEHVCCSPLGMELFPAIANTMTAMTRLQAIIPPGHATRELRTDLSNLRSDAALLVCRTQHENAMAFAPYLEPFLRIFHALVEQRAAVRTQRMQQLAQALSQAGATGSYRDVFDEDDDDDEGVGAQKGNDGCAMQAFNFFCSVLNSGMYRGSRIAASRAADGGIGFDEAAAARAQGVLHAFFTDEMVSSMSRMITLSYLPWTKHDLTQWSTNPEEFFCEYRYRRADSDERSAAAQLLTTFTDTQPALVASVINALLAETAAAEAAAGGAAVGLSPSGEAPATTEVYMTRLRKDAALMAMGKTVFEVQEFVDRTALISHITTVVQDVFAAVGGADAAAASQVLTLAISPGAMMSVYRSVWVASELTEAIPASDLPGLLAMITTVLRVPDMFTALSATLSLTTCVNSQLFAEIVTEFTSPQGSGPSFMEVCFHSLLSVCSRCSSHDAQTDVLTAVSQIVTAVGPAVAPGVPALLEAFPKLWAAAPAESVLRLRVISTVKDLVDSLGGASEGLHFFVLEVLGSCLNPQSPGYEINLEEAMFLWHAVLQNAVHPSQQLFDLFPRWLEHYAEFEENFETGAGVLESYLALFDNILDKFAEPLSQVIGSLFERLQEDALNMLSNVLVFASQRFPAEITRALPQTLRGMLEALGNYSVLGLDADGVFGSQVLIKFTSVFCHLIIRAPSELASFLSSVPVPEALAASAAAAGSGAGWLGALVNITLSLANDVDPGYPQRVAAMALATAMTFPGAGVTARIGDIVAFGAQVVAESGGEDELIDASGIEGVQEQEKTESYRLQLYMVQDTVNQTKLKEFIVNSLNLAAQAHGTGVVQQAVGCLDRHVVAPLGI